MAQICPLPCPRCAHQAPGGVAVRQPDELAATLDRRPVIKLVAHQSTGLPVALERCLRVQTNVFERGQASQRRVRPPSGSFIRAVICLTYSFSNVVSRCMLAISTAESVLIIWPQRIIRTIKLVDAYCLVVS